MQQSVNLKKEKKSAQKSAAWLEKLSLQQSLNQSVRWESRGGAGVHTDDANNESALNKQRENATGKQSGALGGRGGEMAEVS